MFEDAPDVSVYTTIEEIGDQLERMGYDVEWGRTDLNTTDTCWIKIDRFEIAFVAYPGIRYEIRIKQPLSKKSAEAMNDAFRTETVYAGMIK